jgi:hypothetical protein
MPRPRSELTKNRRCVGAHLTPEQYAEWKSLGGQKWLREILSTNVDIGMSKKVHELWDLLFRTALRSWSAEFLAGEYDSDIKEDNILRDEILSALGAVVPKN